MDQNVIYVGIAMPTCATTGQRWISGPVRFWIFTAGRR